MMSRGQTPEAEDEAKARTKVKSKTTEVTATSHATCFSVLTTLRLYILVLTRAKHYDQGQAEAKCLRSRSRPWFRGWDRDRSQNFGLKTSLSTNRSIIVGVSSERLSYSINLQQASRQPQRGVGKHSGAPCPKKNIPVGPLCRGRKFLNFFSKWCTLVYFIFLSDGGAPKRLGARGS